MFVIFKTIETSCMNVNCIDEMLNVQKDLNMISESLAKE